MRQRPLIGILTNYYTLEDGLFAGTSRLFVSEDYVKSIVRAGGVPFMIPMISDAEIICKQVEHVDGLIFSGGAHDVHPDHYQEEPSAFLNSVSHERDLFEMVAAKHAFTLGKPIFGICRGLQLINVAFGGSLYQDLPTDLLNGLPHSQQLKKDEASHVVDVTPNSLLFSIVNKPTLMTNSFHHQSVKKVAPGFCINALSKDGVVEGIERMDPSFVLGVQWHPEMMAEKHPDMQKLFSFFVDKARACQN